MVVGLNGALQRTIVFAPPKGLKVGDVNRASSVGAGIGGKGQNVCVALRTLAEEGGEDGGVDVTLAHFAGGKSGESGLTINSTRMHVRVLCVRCDVCVGCLCCSCCLRWGEHVRWVVYNANRTEQHRGEHETSKQATSSTALDYVRTAAVLLYHGCAVQYIAQRLHVWV